MEDYMLPCLNKKLFGIECLGCGLQRSLALIVKGEFIAAFIMYPAVYPLLTLLFCIALNLIKPIPYYINIVRILGIFTGLTMLISYIYKYYI